jgi:uncharacterized membrane protein YjdF
MQATAAGRVVTWTLLVALGAANVAGYAFDLYRQFWWFDRVLHACTVLAVTLWLALFVFGRVLRRERGRDFLIVLLIACVGIALGALWEVAEWGFNRIAPGDVIKGKHDTLVDILMDAAGAVLAGGLVLKLARPLQ